MAQLTKGMFGREFDHRNASAFAGLRCGQMRASQLIHNGGWYNRFGEKLGWGDLSSDDLRNISKELEEGELLVVLYERDSFWNFVESNPGPIGSMCTTNPKIEAPGIDYVADKAAYIISHNELYYVDRYGSPKNKTREIDGLNFRVIRGAKVKALITNV